LGTDLLNTIIEIERDEKITFTQDELIQKLENLYKNNLIGRENTPFGYMYTKL
jgi:hypothetical protein